MKSVGRDCAKKVPGIHFDKYKPELREMQSISLVVGRCSPGRIDIGVLLRYA